MAFANFFKVLQRIFLFIQLPKSLDGIKIADGLIGKIFVLANSRKGRLYFSYAYFCNR